MCPGAVVCVPSGAGHVSSCSSLNRDTRASYTRPPTAIGFRSSVVVQFSAIRLIDKS